MSHGKAKLTPAGRLLLVERIEREGWPPAHAAAMAGVSRRPRTSGCGGGGPRVWPGCVDRSSRPHHVADPHQRRVEARVCELRRQLRRGPHLLAGRLGMAPSTVHAVLARHGCRGCRGWTGSPAT